jgi:hypothetical protein
MDEAFNIALLLDESLKTEPRAARPPHSKVENKSCCTEPVKS